MKPLESLLDDIAGCQLCSSFFTHKPRPVLAAHPESKLVIIGQAPGAMVHASGIPWDDKSGQNLRAWMGVDKQTFYDASKIALVPMGFCYPGKGKSGDLAPRKECAPLWHKPLLDTMLDQKLVVLIGKYAQDYYLKDIKRKNLTETVKSYKDFLPNYFVLPHPSPRNNIWQAKNEWFKQDVLPEFRIRVQEVLFS
ncbi:MAG: uracil-DNA glycosylase family protein [Flavobacteriales bacterium]